MEIDIRKTFVSIVVYIQKIILINRLIYKQHNHEQSTQSNRTNL